MGRTIASLLLTACLFTTAGGAGAELLLYADEAGMPLAKRWKEARPQLSIALHPVEETTHDSWWRDGNAMILRTRAMKLEEERAFQRHWGYPPAEVPAGFNPLVFLVNQQNPAAREGLCPGEVASIYRGRIRRWGIFDFRGRWTHEPIAPLVLDSSSSIDRYFCRMLLKGEPPVTLAAPRSAGAITDAVGDEPGALGYTALSFVGEPAGIVPMVMPGGRIVPPSEEAVHHGLYPFANPLYLHFNEPPEAGLREPQRRLLELLASDAGQRLARDAGYIPPTPQQLEVLGLRLELEAGGE